MIETTEDRVEDSDAFADWLTIARPGDVCVYHIGHLARDREGKTERAREVHSLAKAALEAGGYHYYRPRSGEDLEPRYVRTRSPKVCLVQRRVKRGFEYLAVLR